ncbi:gluconate 2-dehydrogenase subunit 3 family protein [Phototrophicus methaneseepsis]|uniref:Gluconate 2-dehydrogenase subunit 3 family protein n=1 Tax=Phototrophicus methaneseepsis TaxID=2710758 RepID=A0A7S8E7D4_9CHLR|nr:gluconate 2-dehydrogenase subunit 3 family protein [Phototrophicus methaneseepsis]QPC81738.1 gluconate 2-dehydrogenase subunit 3 family protein [Phototrophicus methaneseepsis]
MVNDTSNTPSSDEQNQRQDARQNTMSRRRFLQSLGFMATAGGAVALGITGFSTPTADEVAASAIGPSYPEGVNPYPYVPDTPTEAPDPDILRVLTLQEALVVDALVARILPGTVDDPGAREANVVVYIDNMLAFNDGFVEATYRSAPFAVTYEGDTPPSTDRFNAIPIAADQIKRYGYQHMLSPLEVYRIGITAVENYAQSQYDASVVDLSDEQQNEIVQSLLDNEVPGFTQFKPEAFFHVLRRHVSEGMFSDPVYGGNRDVVGWQLIGYPGAQRSYDGDEIRGDAPPRPPQTIAQMHHFHPGDNANNAVVLPVSGSDEDNLVDPDEHPSQSDLEEKEND